jgi:opacity protein-like surface antigen
MKLRMAVLALVLTAFPAGVVLAEGKFSLGPIGGFSLPVGDFGDVSGAGFHIGVTGDCELSGGFSVGGDVVWHRSTGKDDFEKDLSAASGTPTDVSFDIWPITVHGKYALPVGAVGYRPYLKAGLGLYHLGSKIDPEFPPYYSDASENKFGLNLGGGATLWRTGPLAVDVEAAFHIVSTEGSSTNLLTVSGAARFGTGAK